MREFWWVFVQDRALGLGRSRLLEGALPGQHLVEHAAEREDVAAGVGRFSTNLFRRHVANCSHYESGIGFRAEGDGWTVGSRCLNPLASPKSRIFTRPSRPRKRFC